MGIGPQRPINDIEAHLKRGELQLATAIAKDCARNNGRPIPLQVALLFLPVVASQQHDAYDRWACKWLARWLTETPGASIEKAEEIADRLTELPSEPSAVTAVKTAAALISDSAR